MEPLSFTIDCRELVSRAAAHDCFARVFLSLIHIFPVIGHEAVDLVLHVAQLRVDVGGKPGLPRRDDLRLICLLYTSRCV